MTAPTSRLPHSAPDANAAGCLDGYARTITPNPKRVTPSLLGFVIFESDEPLFAALKPDHQNVLRLTGSYAEMGEQLQVPAGTLRSRLHRARAALVALRQKHSGPQGLS
jgi:hypothetical protein